VALCSHQNVFNMLTHPSSSDDRPVFADVLATPIRHPVNPRAALPTPVWEVHSTSPVKLILRIQPPLKSHPVLFHVSTPQSRIETRSDAGADTRSHGHIIQFQVAMSQGRDHNRGNKICALRSLKLTSFVTVPRRVAGDETRGALRHRCIIRRRSTVSPRPCADFLAAALAPLFFVALLAFAIPRPFGLLIAFATPQVPAIPDANSQIERSSTRTTRDDAHERCCLCCGAMLQPVAET